MGVVGEIVSLSGAAALTHSSLCVTQIRICIVYCVCNIIWKRLSCVTFYVDLTVLNPTAVSLFLLFFLLCFVLYVVVVVVVVVFCCYF